IIQSGGSALNEPIAAIACSASFANRGYSTAGSRLSHQCGRPSAVTPGRVLSNQQLCYKISAQVVLPGSGEIWSMRLVQRYILGGLFVLISSCPFIFAAQPIETSK